MAIESTLEDPESDFTLLWYLNLGCVIVALLHGEQDIHGSIPGPGKNGNYNSRTYLHSVPGDLVHEGVASY